MRVLSAKDMTTLKEICQIIFDKKGMNILTLDVRGISSICDYFVIAEGTVDRHVLSLATSIMDAMEKSNEYPSHIEGKQQGDWIVLDYSNIIIHLFTPEIREKYAIEEMWQKAEIVDVPIKVGAK